jgi:two-component system, sensor histidine kinase YesM
MKHTLKSWMLVTCLVAIGACCLAQSPKQLDTEPTKTESKSKKLNKRAKDLEDSYNRGDDYGIARNYEALGDDLAKGNDPVKAESYYLKAQKVYEDLKKTDDLARVLRSLGKVQEAQKRGSEAYSNYKRSAEVTPTNQSNIAINENDLQRISNSGKPEVQERYAQQNVEVLNQGMDKDAAADGYGQLADIQLAQNKIPEAVESYQQAVTTAETPELAVKYSNQLSNVYAAQGQVRQAIEVQQKLLTRNDISDNAPQKIAVIQSMAQLLEQSKSTTDAIKLYRESYEIALSEARTLDAKSSLENLVLLLTKEGKVGEAIDLYKSFVSKLDSMLIQDKSLVDNQLFAASEARIAQLEKEKALQDELLSREQRTNFILTSAAALLAILLTLIARAWWAIRRKNKRIALQSLRREMNPHFIFNSLNSVNQFIAANDELAANRYLSAYSQLMRTVMEHSNKDFVRLRDELDMLQKYLALEKQRFPDKFDYEISVDESIDPDAVEIPNLLLQPHLENAIWHGLRYLPNKGMLSLKFEMLGPKMQITITDNGIGLAKSKEMKTLNQQVHQSRGTTNTQERIALLNDLYGREIHQNILERTNPDTGVQVVVEFKAQAINTRV